MTTTSEASLPSPTTDPFSASMALHGRVPPIYGVFGSKGGVGKSMTTHAVIDQLLDSGKQVVFIETDTDNPDVWRCLDRDRSGAPGQAIAGVVMYAVGLDERDGWMDLVDIINEHRDRVVVINTAARMSGAIRKHGGILIESLQELGRKLVALWVINRQRDAMDQLDEFMNVFVDTTVHVVRNGLFGPENKFELYNTSALRTQIEASGGKSVTLPDLADRIADAMYTQRLAICDALRDMTMGNRAEVIRWRKAAHRALEPVFT
jgi:hypothetical protein